MAAARCGSCREERYSPAGIVFIRSSPGFFVSPLFVECEPKQCETVLRTGFRRKDQSLEALRKPAGIVAHPRHR